MSINLIFAGVLSKQDAVETYDLGVTKTSSFFLNLEYSQQHLMQLNH